MDKTIKDKGDGYFILHCLTYPEVLELKIVSCSAPPLAYGQVYGLMFLKLYILAMFFGTFRVADDEYMTNNGNRPLATVA